MLTASNGQEALSLAKDHREPIDLLVTDVVTPEMDGFTLSERLVELHPETQVLFISGYAARPTMVHNALNNARRTYLLKPFTQDRFLQAIRAQLDS